MELRPQYKHTELGFVPPDWDVNQIGGLTEKVGSGVTPTGGNRVYKMYGRPFVRSQNVGWGRLNLDEIAFIDDAIHAAFAATEIRAGDVFLNITGASIGRSAMADERLEGGNVNQHVCIIRANERKLVPGFLCAFLISSLGQRQIDSFQAGGNRQGLNFGQVRSIRIAAPRSIEEQHAIATALRDADALLEELDRLITKKRDLKLAAMQQLLTGKVRLPGFKGEWENKPIGSEIDLLTGFPFPSRSYTKSGIRLLRGSNIKRGVTDWNEELTQYWPRISPDLKPYELREGDIVVAMDGSLVGQSFAQLSRKDLPALLLQRVARIRSKSIETDYLKAHICSPYFTAHCDEVKTVTAIPHISPKDIREFTIVIPPTRDEQTAIAQVLSDMDSEIDKLEQRRAKTANLKQAMMQELLTGKTRLVQPEASA